jgi:hypothetical protein
MVQLMFLGMTLYLQAEGSRVLALRKFALRLRSYAPAAGSA